MHTSLPDTIALILRPHLAVIAMLETALEMTLRSLSASYPNLAEEPEPTIQRYEEDAYVDSIFHQVHALQGLLRSYSDAVERHRQQRRADSDQRHRDISF